MAEYTLTIKIAEGGTKHIDKEGKESSSFAGHMWYSLYDGNENSSYGFASREDKAKPWGEGRPVRDDDTAYQDTYYTLTRQITKEEYDRLREFGESPSDNGFADNYNALSNSCVDFTWKALEHAGMNNEQYEGKILPVSNAYKIDENMYKQMFGSEEGWKEAWDKIYKESRHIIYGNDENNILTGGDKNEVFYAGKGDDVVFGNKGDDTYIYKKGDDTLTIQDSGFDENDKVVIEGFNSEDAVFKLSEDERDLNITFGDEDGSIVIKDYKEDGKIEKFVFDDKELNIEDIERKLQEQSVQQTDQIDNTEPTLRELVEADLGRSITDEEIQKSREELDNFKKEYEQGQTKEQNVQKDDNDNVVMHMQR